MIHNVRIIKRRWQCRLGLHAWEKCLRRHLMTGRYTERYERCFSCGREREPR